MENLENREMPKNNMAIAITATVLGLCPILCCINGVLGAVAIYFATLVEKKYESGDFEGAESAAKNAKLLSLISLGILILGIIYTVLTFDIDAYNEVMEKVQEEMNK